MRNTLQELKLKEKSEGDDKDKIEEAVQETLYWLEGVVTPITMKVYQAALLPIMPSAHQERRWDGYIIRNRGILGSTSLSSFSRSDGSLFLPRVSVSRSAVCV